MTREEAINRLNLALDNYMNMIEDVQSAYDYIIAMEMAIKVLEKEPCEDAISRQAVIECLTWTNDKADIWHRIKALPSVTPHYTDAEIQKMQELEQAEIQKAYELGKASQPKTGHWIDDCGGVKCSCCGYYIDDYYYVKTYCPNCGLKMESEI